MRVIAGTAGGMNLLVPKVGVRPTMDMVKGAIFSMLGDSIVGASVLDLFAGAGGLGIEALSRGAASAVFVEKDAQAVTIIQKNLDKTRLTGRVEKSDAFSYLDRNAGIPRFDFIFADPPYAKAQGERDFGSELVRTQSLRTLLKPDGLFILEQLPGTGPRDGADWVCHKLRRYGATEVAFLGLPSAEATQATDPE